ncbi:MAG: Ig-like domain-containing protein [Tannerellaceae bacterium]|jgi:uncharacterized protein YjdB|nr:Ig-like domain-containing protein [Tannerellaceae bacterium]
MKTVNQLAHTGLGRKGLTVFAVLWMAGLLVAHAQSPYIYKVYDYMPAPGQFVNEMPEYEPGDTQADMNRKAENEIAGVNHNVGAITLGGYGGYVVFGFDHEVENVPGKYDFRILGNAFYADANPNGEASREGGSCEPGIVMVSRDVNNNGVPDDPWYELAGSEYYRPKTIHNYRITYYRPDENKARVPHPSEHHVIDTEYVRWTTNEHGNGYVYRNDYHGQPYFPLWAGDEISFTGTKLADNYVDESGRGVYYVLYAYHWGYADNRPNADNRSGFNIEWAVDAGGQPVPLPGIDFVKVFTAVNQNCGWIGETSTEVFGAEDLHLTGQDATVPVFVSSISLNRSSAQLYTDETLTLAADIAPSNASNQAVTWRSHAPDVASVSAGTVVAHRAGTATIQAIANDGYYIAECRITVRSSQAGPDPEPEPEPEPEPGVAVTGITLSRTQIDMPPYDVASLEATVSPAHAENRKVHWTSSNLRVADVSVNGLVMSSEPGEATITATTDEGGYRAACLVRVVSGMSAEVTALVPQVHYAGGRLHFLNLEGYACTLFSAVGQRIGTFRLSLPDEWQNCRLAPGAYLLTAQKQEKRMVIKIVIRD